MRPPAGLFLVAGCAASRSGCGALKFHGDEPAELKRMWVVAVGARAGPRPPAARRARARAAAHGGARASGSRPTAALTEAIAMYRSAGYREVAAFNDEPYGDHWFEKHLEK